MSIDIVSIVPEIIVVVTGLMVLLLSVFIGKKFDRAIAPVTAAGLIIALAAIFILNFYNQSSVFNNSFITDNFSNFFRIFSAIGGPSIC